MPTELAEKRMGKNFNIQSEHSELQAPLLNHGGPDVLQDRCSGLQDIKCSREGQLPQLKTTPTFASKGSCLGTNRCGSKSPERRPTYFPCSQRSVNACQNIEDANATEKTCQLHKCTLKDMPYVVNHLAKGWRRISWRRRKGEVICVWGSFTGLLLFSCITQIQHDSQRFSSLVPWLVTLSLSLFLLSSLIFDFDGSEVLCNRVSPMVFLMAFLACFVPKLICQLALANSTTKHCESAQLDESVSLDFFLISSLPLLLSCAPVMAWQNLWALSAMAISSFLLLIFHINSTEYPHSRQIVCFSIYVTIIMLSSAAVSYFGSLAEKELMGIVTGWEEALRNSNLSREEAVQAFEENKHESSVKIKEMRNFISYIFHEIRVVLGIGHLLAGEISNDQREVLNMMDASSTSMIRILNDVLDMGKIEAGKLQLEKQPFNMSELVRSLIWAFKDTYESKGLDFSLCIDQSTKDFLCSQDLIGDKHRVRQVLANYLSNAAKFTPRGGKVKLRVVCNGISVSDLSSTEGDAKTGSRVESIQDNILSEISTMFPGEQEKKTSSKKSVRVASLTISVEDTGIGISKEDQAKLFEPYIQIGAGSAQAGGGTGLGLSFAKRIVELAAGNIGVFSEVGRGSIFFITLPFELAATSSQGKRVDALSNQIHFRIENGQLLGKSVDTGNSLLTTGRIPKVLVVEDNQMNRKILRRLLASFNVECEDAEDGKQAIELCQAGGAFDMILIDKEMPVMDGHEATRELRAMGIKVPIVGLTGNALESDRNQFLAAGVDDFFTKPLSRHQLVKLLEAYGLIPCSHD
ncbi:hypothetical protein O6H91_19G043100 [Diphasiastrum complanatum]|uniref:Uncharacterized protein n=1 Tax=Diphasiastrum complanatum TaxID=34168 RepID=A0ACC2AUM0_DIPCM|nr:hypothetical protein O6H91_19G043100 [Diphasiastrum complanatum]